MNLDADPAPRAIGIDEDEDIDGAIAAILVVEALEPSGCHRDRLARFADELGDAPHVLLPRLETVLGQASADGFTRETVMVGQLDHRASQQLQRPAGATFGRARTGGGDEEGFLLLVSFCPRLSASRSPLTKRRLVL